MIEKTLEEIHSQLESTNINEFNVESLKVSNENACSLIVSECLKLFDSTNDDIRVLSIKVIIDLLESLNKDELNHVEIVNGKQILNKYVFTEFEDKLVGDVRVLTKKLVSVMFAEAEGTFKESIHNCLLKIKEKRPLAIAHECFEAKRGGFLKRWEYLDTLLSIPN